MLPHYATYKVELKIVLGKEDAAMARLLRDRCPRNDGEPEPEDLTVEEVVTALLDASPWLVCVDLISVSEYVLQAPFCKSSIH